MADPGGSDPTNEDIELANRLLVEWDEGRGLSKSQLEIRTWNDATSHGRHFDRFVRKTLGVSTNKPSKQSDRIAELERQIRGLGVQPSGATPEPWEQQLQHARASCLAGLRTWNDPVSQFRTGAFALLFTTAWNSLSIALIQKAGGEWRKLLEDGSVSQIAGTEQAQNTSDLVGLAFPEDGQTGMRANILFWLDLRNSVAHRYLPALDSLTIPYAQAGLLNFERVLAEQFGTEYALNESLAVPLQLSGFRDPGVLSSRKLLQNTLPLDVQSMLSRAEDASPELLMDETFLLRVAFVPVVPNSGRNPDAIAYFVKPGEVPAELAQALDQYVVLSKVAMGSRPNIAATDVMKEVEETTGFKFNSALHLAAARTLGVRPPVGQDEKTVDLRYAEYITSFKRWLYTKAWIDWLAEALATPEGFREVTGRDPVPSAQGAQPRP